MKIYSAREIIKKAYGSSKNFVTPHVISYGKINKTMAYEFSWGSHMFGGSGNMYGVSVAKLIKGGKAIKSIDDSKSFHRKSEAKNYIAYLKNKYN